METTRRKHRGLFQDIGIDKDSFHRTPTAQEIREIEKRDYIKLKNSCTAEKTINRVTIWSAE
jgi:hypothetical protein